MNPAEAGAWIDTGKAILDVLVLAVGVGYWAGRVKAGRNGNGTGRYPMLQERRHAPRDDAGGRTLEDRVAHLEDGHTKLWAAYRSQKKRIDRYIGSES